MAAPNPNCPIAAIANILGRKWMLELLFYLRSHNRFSELQAAVGGVNPATLTRRLRHLEREGLVQREVVNTAPVQIEYRLTEKGRDLEPVLDSLTRWSERWLHGEAKSRRPVKRRKSRGKSPTRPYNVITRPSPPPNVRAQFNCAPTLRA